MTALLLVGFIITAQAQPAFTTKQRDSIKYAIRDSMNKERAFVRPQVASIVSVNNKQGSQITALQSQSSGYANSIKTLTAKDVTLETRLAALENGIYAIDTISFKVTGNVLSVKPPDLTALNATLANLQQQLNNIPIIDAAKLQDWYEWLALLKYSLNQIPK